MDSIKQLLEDYSEYKDSVSEAFREAFGDNDTMASFQRFMNDSRYNTSFEGFMDYLKAKYDK